jgi:DNA (cytosine-5)-methyltransferase 1
VVAVRYLSLFSGIEAASVAWHPLGWQAVAFSEVEPFCCELLRQRFPTVPNLGDVTADDFIERAKALGPIDLVVGGSPCQSFSVAGLRGGMNDARGNLALRFVEVVDGLDPTWTLWENVPGVLSDKTNGFGCLLGALAGSGAAIVPPLECGWTDAGVVVGPRRSVAWPCLDAQWFGLAQRRKRVFALAGRGVGAERVAEILLERQGVRRAPPTRRTQGEGSSVDVAPSLGASGRGVARVGESRGQDPVVACFGGGNTSGPVDVATARSAKAGSRDDFESETFVAHSIRADGFDASEDGTGRGTPLVPVGVDLQNVALRTDGKAGTICAESQRSVNRAECVLCAAPALCFEPGSIARRAGPAGEQETVSTLRSEMGDNQHAVRCGMMVRRLTPRECCRLQGFPDDWTIVKVRGKDAADGPRYKALGNSMAVPVMRWIGRRIAEVAP